MKSDGTTTLLNFVLWMLVILGVVFAIWGITRQRELRQLTTSATIANARLLQAQSLLNDATVFNASAKNPDLTRILQSIQPKPAAH